MRAAIPIHDKKDQQIAAVATAVFLLLVALILWLITYQIADPPPQPLTVPASTDLEDIEIKDFEVQTGGGSQGTPNDQPVTEPKPQTQQVLTKRENPDTKTNTGKGSANTKPDPNNGPSNAQQSNNPFGSGGSSNDGDGTGAFGKDQSGSRGNGPGGTGDGRGRIRLNDPNTDDIVSDDNHIIHLMVTINSEGMVVDAKNISAKTTTTDQRLINQVIAVVKSQTRYNKKQGASLEVRYETIRLNAN